MRIHVLWLIIPVMMVLMIGSYHLGKYQEHTVSEKWRQEAVKANMDFAKAMTWAEACGAILVKRSPAEARTLAEAIRETK